MSVRIYPHPDISGAHQVIVTVASIEEASRLPSKVTSNRPYYQWLKAEARYRALRALDAEFGPRPWVIDTEIDSDVQTVTVTFAPITDDTPLPRIPSRGR